MAPEPIPTTARATRFDALWVAAVISAVLGAVAVLLWAPAPTIEKLFSLLGRMPLEALGAALVSAAGIAIAVWRSKSGVGVVLLALALAASSAGCGASAAETHARVLSALDPIAEQAGRAIREHRAHVMEEAAIAAVADGASEDDAVLVGIAAGEPFDLLVSAQVAFDRSIRMYARGLLLNLDGLTLASGLAFLEECLRLAFTMRQIAHDLAPGLSLPAIPDGLAGLLSPDGAR